MIAQVWQLTDLQVYKDQNNNHNLIWADRPVSVVCGRGTLHDVRPASHLLVGRLQHQEKHVSYVVLRSSTHHVSAGHPVRQPWAVSAKSIYFEAWGQRLLCLVHLQLHHPLRGHLRLCFASCCYSSWWGICIVSRCLSCQPWQEVSHGASNVLTITPLVPRWSLPGSRQVLFSCQNVLPAQPWPLFWFSSFRETVSNWLCIPDLNLS